jgi:hypothetical protein
MKLLLLASLIGAVVGQSCQNSVIAGSLPVSILGTAINFTVPQSGGTKTGGVGISGSTLKLSHGVRAYFGSQCVNSFQPTMYSNALPPLLGRTLSFSVDLSQAGCACNAALYLVAMPAYDSSNNPDPTKCGDYYCDANNVCGIYCPEIDIMEANNRAYQATPHKCNAPNGHYYPSCDGGGCGRNTYRLNPNAFGPGSSYTINTQSQFSVNVTFGESGGQLNRITTILSQDGKTFTLTHDDSCGSGYLESLTAPLQAGMVVALSYWGDTASTMSWLDIPPCSSSENCNTNTQFTVSNFRVD